MFDRKLKIAIQKYLDADTSNSKSGAKGAITRLINAASVTDVMLIPDILQEFEELPDWLKLRFQKGSLYREGDRVFGWCREGQVQAVELPVNLDIFSYDDEVEGLRVVRYIIVASESMGFAPPIDLPLKSMDVFFGGNNYRVDVSLDSDNYRELLAAGYASPCYLQWSWSDKEGYVVERSIFSHGFWQAWKWWPDCWQWYYKKRPELFEDAEWWGLP